VIRGTLGFSFAIALISAVVLAMPQVSRAVIPPDDSTVTVVTVAPTTSGPSTTTTTLPSAATTIAPGCPVPQEASVVFVGTVSDVDVSTATFVVDQVRYGTLESVVVGATVGVRYGADVKYLEKDTQYLVGAVIDPASLTLSSTVRDTPVLFGGAAVAAAIEQGRCPDLEAAVRTLLPNGSSIESGVLTPFFDSGWRIMIALILPAILGLVLLLALVWIKRGTQQ
jgi:hypothetical protein